MLKLMSVLVVVAAVPARAETDVASFYEVTTEGTSTRLKAGDTGKVVISIKAKNGAHVSDEAPLKIELSSKESKLSKERLTLADSFRREIVAVRFGGPSGPRRGAS